MGKQINWPRNVKPPVANRIPKQLVAHNETREDEYYWLNDREDPKVLQYLKDENNYVEAMMSGTKDLQDALFNEMKSRIQEKDQSVPYFKNGYWYYRRFEEGLQYPVICRKQLSLEAAEEILLDQNKMAEGYKYYQLGGYQVSDNNEVIAYTSDSVSRRLYNLRFKNLKTGTEYPETIPNVEGSDLAWAADNNTCFYIFKDPVTLLGFQVWRHKLGTDPALDTLVYEEKDNRYALALLRSKSKKYVALISEINEVSTEYLLLPAIEPDASFRVFHAREQGLQYSVQHFEDRFYILTDWNAPNFRLMVTSEKNTAKTNWEELIAEDENVYLDQIEVFRNFLVLSEMRNALSQLRIINLTTKESHYIAFDETAYDASININPEFDTDVLRYSYTSMTTPASIFDYNMVTREKLLLKETPVPGSFRKEDYHSERLWATGRDGSRIPLSIVYRKGSVPGSGCPLLLYAYGSYGLSMPPYFSSNTLSLLDRGFIYAIAHVRGGLELGRKWYDQGRMQFKKNTFFDFIDCAEFLINKGYTSSDHLYAQGGSAGGLLMGAIINFRPDLWNGVIAQVPFVDVITTMSDTSIPLTTLEYSEWGNPAVESDYRYMKSYSPYDNIERKTYPNLLVTTGLYDSQVQYFEPAKWVARLRAHKKGDNKILFKTNMEYGHGGASGRFDYLKERALEFAFLFFLEGITE